MQRILIKIQLRGISMPARRLAAPLAMLAAGFAGIGTASAEEVNIY
jgi:hypothetical protein